MSKIFIISAIQKSNRGIGFKGELLYKISADLKRFKELTVGHPIIMGQKTFESIGRPLPNRTNIVLSNDPGFLGDGILIARSKEEALKLAAEADSEKVFVIGGGMVYKEFLPLADVLLLTLIDGEKPADTFFPDYSEFKNETLLGEGEQGDVKYSFWEFRR